MTAVLNAPALPASRSRTIERLHFVDALRGAAAIYIIVFHVVLVPSPRLAVPAWASPVILNGVTGVTLFFVLSAFTLCYTLDARQGEKSSVKRFYLRRMFRIVPLYYCWLAIMLVRFYFVGSHHGFPVKHCLIWSTFTFNLIPGEEEGLVMASWTLGVEMLFYLLFPLIFWFTRTLWQSILVVLFTSIIAAAHFIWARHHIAPALYERWVAMSLLTQMPVFAVGIVGYHLFRRLVAHERFAGRAGPWLIVLGLIGFFVVPFVATKFAIPNPYPIYPMALVYLAILLGLAVKPAALLVNPATVSVGTVSYSTYLNHPLMIVLLLPLYRRIYAHAGSSSAHLLECLAITLIPLLALSAVTYLVIEQPGIRLGSRLIKRYT